MKKIFTTLLFCAVAAIVNAVPAKPGQWRTIKLADGSTVRVELRGDEHSKWFQAEDGRMFIKAESQDYYVATDAAALQDNAMKRRVNAGKAQSKRSKVMRKVKNPIFQGQRKGLIILVQFTDSKFASGHDVALYEKIANQENYTDGGFYGSVRDYFKAQSDGQFDLIFDVKGIVTLNNAYSYYGQNDRYGEDSRPGQMIKEALEAVKDEIDLADYDWDGDKVAEEVFVVYAGKGEADGGDDNTIWPHMYTLSDATGSRWTNNGYSVDVYACASELNGSSQLDGVGTFCHEFSHCMGFPDMYDTENYKLYGMGDFDLMCGGSYNANGRMPAGYSAYERAECGWIDLIELVGSGTVTNLQPINQGGQGYVVYNQGHPDEYFVIENRQYVGWDTRLPGKGLLISYVDYDDNVWEYNIPNSIVDNSLYYSGYKNDHQRLTLFHADNNDNSNRLYPWGSNNSLTNTSSPAGKTYHANSDGSYLMNISITDITQNSDKTMSFNYNLAIESTGITTVNDDEAKAKNAGWYTIDGRKLNAKPVQKGVYIHKGKKIIVK